MTIRRFLVDTLSMDSVFQSWFQRRFRNPASAFATHRLPRDGYPAFKGYYADAKTASARLLRLRSKLGARYLGLLSLSWRRGAKSSLPILDLVHPGWSLPASFPRRQEALPASLKTPTLLCRALRPRADLHARPLRRFSMAPAITNTKAPSGCILSRLIHTASQFAAYA